MCRSINQLRAGARAGSSGPSAALHCRRSCRQVFSRHAVALSFRARVPPPPGPDGRDFGGAVPPDLSADGRRRSAVRVPVVGGDPAADPQHARGRRVRRGRAPDRHPDLRRRPQRDGGGGRAHHRALPARVHRHQLRLPGKEGGPAERRLGLPPGSGRGRPHHPRGHRRHAPAGHREDAERVERRAAGSGRHRPAHAGRRRAGVHAACPHPHADVLRQGQLGRDRARGRGARHPGHRQRRRRGPPRISRACATTPAARGS